MLFSRLARTATRSPLRWTPLGHHGSLKRPLLNPTVFERPAQTRGYRPVNHRQLLASWNTIRLWLRSPLFYFHIAGIGGLTGLYYLYNLEKVPITQRWRFNVVSQHHEKQLADRLFRDVVDDGDNKILPSSSKEHTAVQRVFDQLLPTVGLIDADWEVHVIDDPETMNAFVLPGGKVFVYTGLLNLCSSEDELATVLGHEIAHNICRHGCESVSRNLLWVPMFVVGSLASGLDPDLVEVAMDVAFKYPHSRMQEAEADFIGFRIMAESGYDAFGALSWWRKMEEVERREHVSYMSTHPSHHNRLGQLHTWLMEARQKRVDRSFSLESFRASYFLQRQYCGLSRHPET